MLSKTAILHKWDNTMMEQVQSLMTCDTLQKLLDLADALADTFAETSET